MRRTTLVIAVAGLIYAVAWLLPVHEAGTRLGHGELPGWEALRIALRPIWSYEGDTGGDGWFFNVWSTISGLTNLAFLAALAILARGPRRAGSAAFWALLIAAFVNTLWFVTSGAERTELRIGYYLWLSAFVLLAAGARMMRPGAERPAEPTAA